MRDSIAKLTARTGKRGPVAIAAIMATLAGVLLTVSPVGAATNTVVVDEDGHATKNSCDSTTVTPYSTVGSAITAAAAGDIIKVCPGSYDEDVVVDKGVTLRGAKAGVPVGSRTFGSGNESMVTGLVTVQSPDVTVEGFSLTNPGQGLGVIVKTTAAGAVIKKNIVKTVGSNTFVGPTVGIYLELGPDDVQVVGNKVSDVQSQTGSAQGVLVGDSSSANPSLNTRIDNNSFSSIMSISRGAYGVQLNNGASAASTATGYTEAKVRGNTIKDLTGNWVHAIGLEGETPNVVVSENVISNLTDGDPTPQADVIGVYFEDNQFFFTGEVNRNSLAVGSGNSGIAVAPALSALYPSLSVDGECNWWGSKSGAGAVASGMGAKVSAGVDYSPWLKSSNLDKDCDDSNRHDSDNHWGDWSDWDHDDRGWRNDN
jgi:hypothetical protein